MFLIKILYQIYVPDSLVMSIAGPDFSKGSYVCMRNNILVGTLIKL